MAQACCARIGGWAVAPLLLVAACGGGGGADGPSVPVTVALTATADTPAQVSLAWSAPADQTQFDVFRNGVAVSATHIAGRGLTEFTLEPATRYCYTVNAVQFPLGIVGTSNAACVTTPPTAGWAVETVDTGDASGLALALDRNDAAHASYRSGGELIHLGRAGGQWKRSTVDAAAGSAGASALAVDQAGAVHLSYYAAAHGSLRYATDRAGSWSTLPVGVGGFANAIALDAGGQPHIAYGGDPNLAAPLMVAAPAGGTWTSEFVAAGPVQRVSLAIGSATMDIGVATGDGVACAVLREHQAAGAWSESVVAPGATCGTAMAVDATGVVHLAYMARTPAFVLMHASNAGGPWTVTQVDAFYWIPRDDVAIALDATGRVHLSYTDHSGLLKYATDRSGAWMHTWVDTHAGGSALQVGRDGRPRIAYAASGPNGRAELRYTAGP